MWEYQDNNSKAGVFFYPAWQRSAHLCVSIDSELCGQHLMKWERIRNILTWNSGIKTKY